MLTYLAPILTHWQINSAKKKTKTTRSASGFRSWLWRTPLNNLFSKMCALTFSSLIALPPLCSRPTLQRFFGPKCLFFSLSPVSTQMSYQHSREDAAYHNFFFFFLREDIWYTWELSQLTEWSVYSKSICILIVCEQGECESSEGFGRKDMIAFMSHQAACWILGNA